MNTGKLRAAAEEIRSLRRRLEISDAKVGVMDLFATVLMTRPHLPTQAMGEDLAWALDKEADQIDAENEAKTTKARD